MTTIKSDQANPNKRAQTEQEADAAALLPGTDPKPPEGFVEPWRAAAGYHRGLAKGTAGAARYVMDKAVEAFAQNEDHVAQALRRIAGELGVIANNHAEDEGVIASSKGTTIPLARDY